MKIHVLLSFFTKQYQRGISYTLGLLGEYQFLEYLAVHLVMTWWVELEV